VGPHGAKWTRSRILGRNVATYHILTLDKVGRGSKNIIAQDVGLTLGSASLGDGRSSFGPGARNWIFSQLHRQNVFQFGGGLEERPAQETLGDQIFLVANLSGNSCPRHPNGTRLWKR